MAVTSWASLEQEGRVLVERLGGRWSPGGGLCRCPAHEDRTPSLSVRVGRTRLLLHCFAGCSAPDILKALTSARLLEPGAPLSAGSPPPGPDRPGLRDAAIRLWGGGRELTGTPAARYLALRGLDAPSPELRFHPRTPHGPKPFTQFRPALLAAVRDRTGLVAVHRTFLDVLREGKVASRPLARAGLGPFGRGAVRLGGIGARLGLAEGIETALSASVLFGMPCWAALGTERFPLLDLPDVSELHLFLDHDAGGRRAEALAREACGEVLPIVPHFPKRRGEDWNDVLRRRLGLDGNKAQGRRA